MKHQETHCKSVQKARQLVSNTIRGLAPCANLIFFHLQINENHQYIKPNTAARKIEYKRTTANIWNRNEGSDEMGTENLVNRAATFIHKVSESNPSRRLSWTGSFPPPPQFLLLACSLWTSHGTEHECQWTLYLQSISTADEESFTLLCQLPASTLFLARLIFDHEDGGDTFLRNVGPYTNYTIPYPRR
jgi:hypothetical protein